MIERSLLPVIGQDLSKKMVMIAGPRQCGKTTLAREAAKNLGATFSYYNWDIDEHRKLILKNQLDTGSKLWILDELHKYRYWKKFLKGNFDQHHPDHLFLVTGSAKLDAYSRGGDSLQGRYFFHRLHPFTLSELLGKKPSGSLEERLGSPLTVSPDADKILEDLSILSGFPEPFLSGSQKEANRWRLAYGTRLVRQEVRDLENIQHLDKLELLFEHLPRNISSVLSVNSLREDLDVAFETVRHWLTILENIYAVFRLPPFGAPRLKAVKKEQKLYFWDGGKAPEEAARFENLVALHLLTLAHWQRDVEGENFELRYFRDVYGHEVDFILLKNGKPHCAIEVKSSEQPLDRNLKYLLERIKIPHAFQLHFRGNKDYEPPPIHGCKIRVMPAATFLANLV